MTRLRAVWHRLLRGHPRRPLFGRPEVCVTCDWLRFPYSEYRPVHNGTNHAVRSSLVERFVPPKAF